MANRNEAKAHILKKLASTRQSWVSSGDWLKDPNVLIFKTVGISKDPLIARTVIDFTKDYEGSKTKAEVYFYVDVTSLKFTGPLGRGVSVVSRRLADLQANSVSENTRLQKLFPEVKFLEPSLYLSEKNTRDFG